MKVIIYFNENSFYKKEQVNNIKKIGTVDNKLLILTEKGVLIEYDTYVIDSYHVEFER